jgi:hypothetical protein
LIDLYEAHKKDRDKFAILAFHDGTVKDFAELDKNLQGPRTKYWGGSDLPFPILLDSTGQTIKDWGVHAFPTTLLIDPDGKLVGQVREEELAEKLPPLPMSVRIAKGMDRNISLGIEDPKLEEACKFLALRSHLPIRLDEMALKSVGVTPQTRAPLTMAGSVSLRSWLALVLEGLYLHYEEDDKGLVIRAPKPGEPPPPYARPLAESAVQRAARRNLEKMLDQKVSFEFKDKPLAEVVRFFENKTREAFILDPLDRRDGMPNLKSLVSGSAKDVPLREALNKLLDPLEMGFTIRNEVVVLTARRPPPGK